MLKLKNRIVTLTLVFSIIFSGLITFNDQKKSVKGYDDLEWEHFCDIVATDILNQIDTGGNMDLCIIIDSNISEEESLTLLTKILDEGIDLSIILKHVENNYYEDLFNNNISVKFNDVIELCNSYLIDPYETIFFGVSKWPMAQELYNMYLTYFGIGLFAYPIYVYYKKDGEITDAIEETGNLPAKIYNGSHFTFKYI